MDCISLFRRFFRDLNGTRWNVQVYVFDGSTGVVVPPKSLTHNLTRNFTVALWLKHALQTGQDKHVKEHILCNADDHRKSDRRPQKLGKTRCLGAAVPDLQ